MKDYESDIRSRSYSGQWTDEDFISALAGSYETIDELKVIIDKFKRGSEALVKEGNLFIRSPNEEEDNKILDGLILLQEALELLKK